MTLEERMRLTGQKVGETPLKVNPNLTFSSIFSPDELQIAGLLADPELQVFARTQLGDERVDEQIANFKTIRDKLIPKYDLPPIDYDIPTRHPAYTARLNEYEQALKDGPSLRSLNPFTVNPSLSPGENLAKLKPNEPFGLSAAQEIASYGIDPAKELDFDGITKFKSLLAFGGPRNYTPEPVSYTHMTLQTSHNV